MRPNQLNSKINLSAKPFFSVASAIADTAERLGDSINRAGVYGGEEVIISSVSGKQDLVSKGLQLLVEIISLANTFDRFRGMDPFVFSLSGRLETKGLDDDTKAFG